MSKAVLVSIQPKWCSLITSGRKTVELRKTKPKLECPFKCYIYCTQGSGRNTFNVPVSPEKIRKHYEETGSMVCLNSPVGNGKVIGEFVCDGLLGHCEMANADIAEMQSLVRREKILEYAGGKEVFGWHISDLVIYDKPKELREFTGWRQTKFGWALVPVSRPPQSWHYVEELPKGGEDND